MTIQLSDHFNYKKLLRFTLPSVAMMIFTSIYGVVDGFFVSNFVGKTPFAAVNFIMPFLMILGSFGFMFGSGGSALISKTMGEGDNDKAQRLFSLLIYTTAACGVVLAVLGIVFLRSVASFLGAEGTMLDDCVAYGRIILPALPALMLQYEFQSFFITAEKPQLGLAVTVAAGVANMLLDALFTAAFSWGACRRSACNRLQPGARRSYSADLFQPQKFKPSSARENKNGRQGSAEGLRQRLLRADEQYFDICCQHAV